MKTNFILGVFTILILLSITLYFQSTTIGITLIVSFLLGIVFSLSNISDRSDVRNGAITVFLLIYGPYVLYSLIGSLNFIDSNDFFLYPDQHHFYEIGDSLSRNYSLVSIFNDAFIKRIHIETEGAHFTFGSLAYIANTFFDGNSVFFQSLWVSFFGVMINVLLYKILLYYVDVKLAVKYTVAYALFSGVFFFSPWILRDIHIGLLYAIGLYLIHTSFSLKRFLLFIPLVVITFEFRLEHGLFYLIFPSIYVYLARKTNPLIRKAWGFIVSTGIGVIVALAFYLAPRFKYALSSMGRYAEFTSESLGDGMGARLYALPMGVKEIAIALFSQFHPFPPWGIMERASNIFEGIIGGINMITTITWSILFLFLVFVIILNYKNFMALPDVLRILLFTTFVFFLLNTANMHPRRILGMYPVLLISFAYFNITLPKNRLRIYRTSAVSSYIGMLVLYLFLKYGY